MMRKTVILLVCSFGVVLSSPVGSKNMPIMRDEQTEPKKTEVVRTTLNLPSNATSIRADIVDGFTCVNKTYGYYADIGNDCQIFHVCLPVVYADGKENTFRWSFICPEETLFSQESFTCVRGEDMNIDCGESEKFYYLNRNIGMGPSSTMQLNDMEDDLNEYLMKSDFESADNMNVDTSSVSKAPIVEKVQNSDDDVLENKTSMKKKWQKDNTNVLGNKTASAKDQQKKGNLEETTVSNRRKISVKGSQIKANPQVNKKSKPSHVVITRRKYNNNYKTAQKDKDNVLSIKPLTDVQSADEIPTTTKKSTVEDPNMHLIKTNLFATYKPDTTEKQEQNVNVVPIIIDSDSKITTQKITEPEKIPVNEMDLKDQKNEKDKEFEDKTDEATETLPLEPPSTRNSVEQNVDNSQINDPVPSILSSDAVIEELQKEHLSPQQAEDFIIKEITSLVNAANLEGSKATTNDEVEQQSDMISSLPDLIPFMDLQEKNDPKEAADIAIKHKESFPNEGETSSIIPLEFTQSSSLSEVTESIQQPEIQGTLEGSFPISIQDDDETTGSNSNQHYNPTQTLNKMDMQTNQHYPLQQGDMVLMSHSNVAPNKPGHKKIIPMSILNENGDTIAQFGRPHVFNHMKPIVERIIPVQIENRRTDDVIPIFHRKNNYQLNLMASNPPEPTPYRTQENREDANSQAITQRPVEEKEQTVNNQAEDGLNEAPDNSMKVTSSEIKESPVFSAELPSKSSMQNEKYKPTNLSISLLEMSEPIKDGRTALDSRRRRLLFRADAH